MRSAESASPQKPLNTADTSGIRRIVRRGGYPCLEHAIQHKMLTPSDSIIGLEIER